MRKALALILTPFFLTFAKYHGVELKNARIQVDSKTCRVRRTDDLSVKKAYFKGLGLILLATSYSKEKKPFEKFWNTRKKNRKITLKKWRDYAENYWLERTKVFDDAMGIVAMETLQKRLAYLKYPLEKELKALLKIPVRNLSCKKIKTLRLNSYLRPNEKITLPELTCRQFNKEYRLYMNKLRKILSGGVDFYSSLENCYALNIQKRKKMSKTTPRQGIAQNWIKIKAEQVLGSRVDSNYNFSETLFDLIDNAYAKYRGTDDLY